MNLELPGGGWCLQDPEPAKVPQGSGGWQWALGLAPPCLAGCTQTEWDRVACPSQQAGGLCAPLGIKNRSESQQMGP